MNEIPGLNLLPEKWRGPALLLFFLAPYITRAWHALTNGGGLKGIWNAILFGTNTPNNSAPPSKPPTAPLVALLLTFGAAGLLFLTPGCGTPQAKVYQAEGVTIHTVDTAMWIWADHVRAGKATPEQIAAVKRAYVTYYDAQQCAKAALEKWIVSEAPAAQVDSATANAAVGNAVNAVCDLVRLYTK